MQEEVIHSKVSALVRQEIDHRALALELDDLLQAEIGYDMAAWSSMDPATMLVTSCTLTADVEVDYQRELRTFELEWSGTDPNTYVEIAEARIPAAALSEVEPLACPSPWQRAYGVPFSGRRWTTSTTSRIPRVSS